MKLFGSEAAVADGEGFVDEFYGEDGGGGGEGGGLFDAMRILEGGWSRERGEDGPRVGALPNCFGDDAEGEFGREGGEL